MFITDNRFVGNATALFFDGAPQSRGGRVDVRGEPDRAQRRGRRAASRARAASRIWENAFVGNRTEVQMVGTGAVDGTEWAVDGRGNYWSDAVVYDRERRRRLRRALPRREHLRGARRSLPVAGLLRRHAGGRRDRSRRRVCSRSSRRGPSSTDPAPLVHPPLTDWLSAAIARAGPGLALAGVGLLAAVAGAARWSRRVLS